MFAILGLNLMLYFYCNDVSSVYGINVICCQLVT